jgi:PLP dependent protein
MVQSLDRPALAESLNRHAAALGRRLPCLVEVKISPEPSKSGVAPEALDEFLDQAREHLALEVQGLMGIAPAVDRPEEARPAFAMLRRLAEKARLAVLSMGMSADFEIAIEEGATMVRLGTVLFGTRA